MQPDMQPVISPDPPHSNPLQVLLLRFASLNPRLKLTLCVAAGILFIALLGALAVLATHKPTQVNTVAAKQKKTVSTTPAATPKITSFAECKAAAGSTLNQATPQACMTSNGQAFTDPTPPVPAPAKPTPVAAKPSTPSGGSGGTTTPPPAGSGLNCPNPIYTTSWPQTQYGGWQDANGTRVNANVLTGAGGSKSQVLNICSATNWNVVANFPNSGGSINTYPDTEYDMTGDKTISQYSSMATCFGSKPPIPTGPTWPTPGGSEWDYAYDVWINHHTGENIWSNDVEIMVWNDWTDSIYPPSGSRATTIDGIAYHMFQGGGANEWIYTRDVKAQTGCFDMLNIMKDLVANNSAAAGITLASVPEHIEYGVEIAGSYGTQTFQITNASLTVQ